MPTTSSSRRTVAGIALASLLLAQACTTTRTFREAPRRGKLVNTFETEAGTTESAVLTVHDDVARLSRERKKCVRITHEYARIQDEVTVVETEDVSWLWFVGGVAAMGLGGILLLNALSEEEESSEELDILPILMGSGLLGGGFALVTTDLGDTSSQRKSSRTLPAEGTMSEQSERCGTEAVRTPGPAKWAVTLGGRTRNGSTDESGELHLRPIVLSLLSDAARDEALMRRIVTNREIPFSLVLGGHRRSLTTSTRNVPDPFFRTFADRYGARLSGFERTRWENCGIIGGSARESLECFWSQ